MATISTIQTLIDTIATGENNTALRLRNAYNAIVSQFFIGEIKWLKLTYAQVVANFDLTTGLGTSEAFLGWKICQDDGRVSIAFGAVYSTLGATGGSKDAVVVEHGHNLREDLNATDQSNTPIEGVSVPIPRVTNDYWRTSSGSGDPANGITQLSIVESGVSGTDKNMQPYVVELKIQRIA